jgi:predicted dehydrogenase
MIRTGVVGLGKMGISHCAILNAHPDVDLVAVCDTSTLMLSALSKYAGKTIYEDFRKMIDEQRLDALFVATPTKLHAPIVNYALEKNIHVFCEKPFCLTLEEGQQMVDKAEGNNLVNQVGYHNRFIGTFKEAKRLVDKNVIGEIYHITGEAYGPVVLREKSLTWRSDKKEGGGCLYDYASHVINLMEYMVGSPQYVSGTEIKKIYSKGVDDAVYSTLTFENNVSGQLSVNWSDETYRKMYTSVTMMGKRGKIICDALECKVYIKGKEMVDGFNPGWNIRYITDFAEPLWYFLRGEEYSTQIDYFINCVKEGKRENVNSFRSALSTDQVIEKLFEDNDSRVGSEPRIHATESLSQRLKTGIRYIFNVG